MNDIWKNLLTAMVPARVEEDFRFAIYRLGKLGYSDGQIVRFVRCLRKNRLVPMKRGITVNFDGEPKVNCFIPADAMGSTRVVEDVLNLSRDPDSWLGEKFKEEFVRRRNNEISHNDRNATALTPVLRETVEAFFNTGAEFSTKDVIRALWKHDTNGVLYPNNNPDSPDPDNDPEQLGSYRSNGVVRFMEGNRVQEITKGNLAKQISRIKKKLSR